MGRLKLKRAIVVDQQLGVAGRWITVPKGRECEARSTFVSFS